MAVGPIVSDMEDVEKAYDRVRAELDTVDASDLSTMNVDLLSATSVVLGVSERVLSFRERAEKLPEFDIANFTNLVDYAKAALFLYLASQPPIGSAEGDALMKEATALRAKLLLWTPPLVATGLLDEYAVARVREGSGNKDLAADLIALVAIYRSRWQQVQAICGVTEADVFRASELGPTVFGMVSRKENALDKPNTEGSLRLRRAWTRLDRAYAECRRAIEFFRSREQDVDEIAPNLRRNSGVRSTKPSQPVQPASAASETAGGATLGSASAGTGATLGSGGSPFVTNKS